MRNKQKIFLCIGLLIFAVTFVVIAIDAYNIAQEAYERAAKENSGPFWAAANFTVSFEIIFFAIPFLLSELSLIKNGYTLLKDGQPKARKVLCVISSILALLVIIMFLLIKERYFKYIVSNTILLTLWPCVIVSFVLGCIRKCKATALD